MNCAKGLLAVAQLFVIFALVFLSLSLATDYWVEYNVNRATLQSQDPTFYSASITDLEKGKVSHDRNVGLFRTCWTSNDTICKYIYLFTFIVQNTLKN